MKDFRFRLIIILAFTALSFYLLYPTYVDYQNSKKISAILNKETQRIKTENPGITRDELDGRLKAIEDSIKLEDPSIAEARKKRMKLGLDLQGE